MASKQHQLLVLSIFSIWIGLVAPMPAPGGHFRSASLAWRTVSGNTVEFELQTAWRRSFEGFYVNGLSAMGEIYEGDLVSIGGSSSPKFEFGDGEYMYIKVGVTAFSVVDDWIYGVTTMNHTYSTPNRGYREDIDRYGDLHITQGAPWTPSFSGCCRLSNLQNQAGESWNMTAALDLQQSSGFPALRSMAAIAFPRTPAGVTPLCAFLNPPSNAGTCTKLEFSTLPCADHQSPMGAADGFIVSRTAETPSTVLLSAQGVVRILPCSAGCPDAGLHSVPATVRDGRVAHVRVLDDGFGGACDSGELLAAGGSPEQALAGTYTVSGGRIAGVLISNHGSGYQDIPTVRASACVGALLEAVVLETPVSVLVAVQPRHTCTNDLGDAVCDPTRAGVQYQGHPLPSVYASSFPFIGYGWDAAALRVVPPLEGFAPSDIVGGGAGGVQTSHGHAVAFAGREWAAEFEGTVNWCQQADGSVPVTFRTDSRCIVPEAEVTLGFSRLPEGAELWTHQEDAIVELLLTYDNPFEAHRPGHEWAVAREQRELVDHPSAEQALQLGFEQLPTNLNSGNGGASVFLWVRRFDPAGADAAQQRAITHLNVSASEEEEAALEALGFEQLPGNLNEQAGGAEVHIWFKRSSGSVPFSPRRPSEDGLEVAIAELAVLPARDAAPQPPLGGGDANAFANGTQALAGWERVEQDLNAGLTSPLHLWYRRGVANPLAQTVRWRPCHCDVGRHFVCVAARSSLVEAATGQRGSSEQRCLALDVLPDSLPQFRSPAANSRLQLYVGREHRSPVAVAVEDPAKQVALAALHLPPGAALDLPYQPSEGCEPAGGCYWRARDLVWTPAWNQGGLAVEVCFTASDESTGCEPPGQEAERAMCVELAVERCVYALQHQQHLQEVAALFATDWLNLFSLNPSIKTPDRILYEGQLVNFGHLYTVVAGDTAANIAKRFGSSLEMLLATNADLEAADSILVGQQLCIIPNSCAAGAGL